MLIVDLLHLLYSMYLSFFFSIRGFAPSTEISPLPRLNSFSSEVGVLHHQAVWDTQPLDGCGMVFLL